MADVVLDQITKRFGDVVALKDVSLDIEDGEFFCILGPPGAGKTTLLKTIAGLDHADAGSVSIGGQDVADLEPGARDVAIVFQNLALYPDKTVFGNLAFPLKQHKVAKQEIKRRVEETARTLHIEHLLDRKPARLSGGERQRVAIGRALVRSPKVCLLDEPLSALDALLRMEMRAELKHLQRDLGRTLIYMTHDQTEALSMADRVCVLHLGEIQQVGGPEEVYERPANVFVAGTVGAPPMNLIAARLDNGAGHRLRLESPRFVLEGLVDGALEGLAARSPCDVEIGVRAEDVRIAEEGAVMRCPVIALESLGGETIVDLDLDGRIMKAAIQPERSVAPDEVVPVAFDLSRIHVFDSAGNALWHAGGETFRGTTLGGRML